MGLTPMMQQYLEIKEQCKDCILFFRLGDFYEMFFEDAETASRVLELVLTGRDCGLEKRAPMCGLPYHAAESYIGRLIDNGYKVAICEQVEDPALAKGIVKREIIRIITPGTIINSNMLDERKNNYIGSITIVKDYFAISICDISTGEFFATSAGGNISRAIDELSKYNPSELLIIDNDYVNEYNFVKILKEKYQLMINIVKHESFMDKSLTTRFGDALAAINEYESQASACLYNYLCETQKHSLSQISSLKHYEIKDYMVLDLTSRKNLELTETIRSKNKKGSLLWVLDRTRTAMGGRTLRRWIEEPLIDKERINERLEVVEEFINNVYAACDLKEFLKNVYDIERLISRISSSAANAKDLYGLKESLRHLPDIKSVLSSCGSNMLKGIYREFDTLDDIFSLIDASISDNPTHQLKEGGLIKSGFNSEVDKLREAMKNGKGWIAELEQKERELTGIKSLKISYNRVFGYYIEITRSNFANIPEDRYIRKQTLANAERFITQELKEMEELILGSEQKLYDLEYELFTQIRDKVSAEVIRVQKTANIVSTIDALLSFADVSFENNYVKPEIINDGRIIINEGRHPVVEKVIQNIFVPNDTFIDTENNVIAIITGPNMAGKSTYMRQVALITLIGQIGCFVPAKAAQISIVDRIFTRIGASDDLSSGQSTFMVEMSEVSNILENATQNSLIILDEVGRGTSTFDGLSIAWAVVDYISSRIGAKTLFATHYHELTELEGKIPGVKNYCISVKEHGDSIIFLRKIVVGGADQSYGIQVAKLAGLPKEVVLRAKDILVKLEEKDIIKNFKVLAKSSEGEAEAAAAMVANKDNNHSNISASVNNNSSHNANTGSTAGSNNRQNQLNLFNFRESEIIDELKAIDILNTSPMEAINYLHTLCQKARKLD